MKKVICLTLALLLCLSGLALSEAGEGMNGYVAEYPSLGFTLRLLNQYMDDIKGLVTPGLAMALDSESDPLKILMGDEMAKLAEVGFFTVTYFCLTEEEYDANEESGNSSRNLEAEMPFISLLVIKDGLSPEELARIAGGPVDLSTMEVQAKVDGYTFYKDRSVSKKELPNQAYAEEYELLLSRVDDILNSCDYYAPYNPYAEKTGTKLSFETTDLDGNPIDSAELFSRHAYTLLNIWASWCGPCAEELAELDAINNRLAAVDCGVVGLLEDSAKESNVEKAKGIMAEKGAHYLCIKAPEGLDDMLFFQYYPTTSVIDRSGTVVGDAIVGAYVDSYEKTIMTLLKNGPSEAKEAAQEEKPTYTVRVVDQNGDPVPEAAVGFCLDTGCIPVETDENGVAVYSGAPARYHIQVVDAPDEYDYPDDTDFYLGPESGEMTLVITKE